MMSRYVIEDDGRREVVVGWDPPLGTFFAQVFAPQLSDDEWELIWAIGQSPREVTTTDELALALEEQGITLVHEARVKLREDQTAPWTPGPLQRMLGFTG